MSSSCRARLPTPLPPTWLLWTTLTNQSELTTDTLCRPGARAAASTAKPATTAACTALETRGFRQKLLFLHFARFHFMPSSSFLSPPLSGAIQWLTAARRTAVSMAACPVWTTPSPLTAACIRSTPTQGAAATQTYPRLHPRSSHMEPPAVTAKLPRTALAPDRHHPNAHAVCGKRLWKVDAHRVHSTLTMKSSPCCGDQCNHTLTAQSAYKELPSCSDFMDSCGAEKP